MWAGMTIKFNWILISLSHRSGGILDHSLQRCSSLLRCVGICLYTALTTSHPVASPNHGQALAVGWMSSHLSLEYFGIQRSSWSTQWLRGTWVLWLQDKPKIISMCYFWYEVFVLMCSLGFHQTCHCALWPEFFLEVLWFVQMQICKPKMCCMLFFLDRIGFLLASLANMPYLAHIFHEFYHLTWWLMPVESAVKFLGCMPFLWVLHSLILGWISWDVHCWEDWCLLWMSFTCE